MIVSSVFGEGCVMSSDELGENASQVLGLKKDQNRVGIGGVADGGEGERLAVHRNVNAMLSARADRESQPISSTHEWIPDAPDVHLMAELKL